MKATHTPKSRRPQTQDSLIVFAKAPVPGRVKTRLTPYLSEEQAADLYEAFLRDALALYDELPVDVRLYVPRPGQIPEDLLVRPGSMRLFRQRGEGLGRRMRNAFEETLDDGYARAIITGTDHPTLPIEVFEKAFRSLKGECAICIGPSEDGGYYLFGMNAFFPEVFEGMTYSHSNVYEQTQERIASLGVRVRVLPEWFDVDTPGALRRLEKEAGAAEHALPHTTRAMKVML